MPHANAFLSCTVIDSLTLKEMDSDRQSHNQREPEFAISVDIISQSLGQRPVNTLAVCYGSNSRRMVTK